MSKQGINLSIGLINSIWSAVLSLAVVPIYLKYLGIEAYGLIGFFATIQALLQFLDFGFAPTINRDVARSQVSGNFDQTRNLLHTVATIYWGMAIIILIIVLGASHFISENWLHPKHLNQDTVTHSIMLMGVVVACRWPVGIYMGVLMGAQRLALTSSLGILVATLGNLGAIFVLAKISATIETFFIWQVFVSIAYVMIFRYLAWRVIKLKKNAKFDTDEIKRIWKFSVGMVLLTFSAVVFTQIDKVLLSKMLSLADFGGYMLAVSVANSLSLIVAPFYNLLYPYFSTLHAAGDQNKLIEIYRLSTRVLAAVLFALAMVLVVFSEELIFIWTGNAVLAKTVSPIVAIFAVGSALHGVMHIPHALQLACGMVRLPLIINAILIVLLVPLIVILVKNYGGVGGAVAWLILHLIYMLLGTFLTHRVLLKGLGMKWLLSEVFVPFVIASVAGCGAYFMVIGKGFPIYIELFYASLLALAVIGCSVVTSSRFRQITVLSFTRLMQS